MISVPLHEALDLENIAREGQPASRLAPPEGRVGAVVHLVEPVGRVEEFPLK